MKDLHTLDKYRMKDHEILSYGTVGNGGNGCFKVYIGGKSFFVIASNGGGWDHVSVSPGSLRRLTCLTWEEMCAIKDIFFYPEECVVQYHSPRSQYVNNYEYCLHLWRPNDGTEIPAPPMDYV